jgi:hypothetical protein
MVIRPLPQFLIILALCLAGTQLGAQSKPPAKAPSESQSKTPPKSKSKTPSESPSKTPPKPESGTPSESQSKTPAKPESKPASQSQSPAPLKPVPKVSPEAQSKPPPKPESRLQGKKVSIILQGGVGFPMAKDSLTDIWRYGPNFSLDFLTSVSRHFSAGVGVDLTVLRWSYAGYYEKYPSGPPPLDRKVIWWDLYLLGRYTFAPTHTVTPFVTLKLGATRPTPASFKQVVDSVKITYYSVPARTRLSVGVSAGIDAAITKELAFVAEANAVLVHNDPVLGAAVSIRGGFRVTW